MIKHRTRLSILILGFGSGLLAFLALGPAVKQVSGVQKTINRRARQDLASKLNPLIVTSLSPAKPELCIEELNIHKGGQPLQHIRGNVGPGESIGLGCSIYNLGTAVDPSLRWNVGYFIDGTLVGTKLMMMGLSTGRGPLLGISCSAPQTPGVHYYECRLDVDGVIDEPDKRNNRAEIPFRVGPPTPVSGDQPDLTVSDIRLDGTRLVVWVQNIGGKEVNGVSVLLYVNGNAWEPPVFLGGTRLGINPGDYLLFTNSYWNMWFDPTFVYKAVVDPSNKIAESNEINNSLSVRFAF